MTLHVLLEVPLRVVGVDLILVRCALDPPHMIIVGKLGLHPLHATDQLGALVAQDVQFLALFNIIEVNPQFEGPSTASATCALLVEAAPDVLRPIASADLRCAIHLLRRLIVPVLQRIVGRRSLADRLLRRLKVDLLPQLESVAHARTQGLHILRSCLAADAVELLVFLLVLRP